MRKPSIYRACGALMVICICMAGLSSGEPSNSYVGKEKNRHDATRNSLVPTHRIDESPVETRITLLRFADAYRDLGDYSAAEAIVKELLDLSGNSLSTDEPEIAIGLVKVGRLSVEQGKYLEAKTYYQRALFIIDGAIAPGSSGNFPLLSSQAESENGQTVFPDSELVYQRLLSFSARRVGHEEPVVAVILRDLAELYRSQGKYDAAEPYYDYALAILRKTLGANHPEYSFTRETYVSMQREQEDMKLINGSSINAN